MTEGPTYVGRCFCGEVVLQAVGEPIISGFCHCDDCRAWSACPVTAYAKWPFDAVAVLEGESSLATYSKTERTPRAWCTKCGGHIGEFRPNADPPHVVVFPAIFPGFAFKPEVHVWCKYSVVALEDDGLRKHEKSIQNSLG